MEKILVTGSAGFIGFHISRKLIQLGYDVIGIDNLNNYYDINLKKSRLAELKNSNNFQFYQLDIVQRQEMADFFNKNRPEKVVHLAAQAGVRYSLDNPYAYVDSNIIGFMNILEGCRYCKVKHLIYASSSSVYGANDKKPFGVDDRVDQPTNLYAATKKSNELMAYSYSYLYNLPVTGLRLFTVYGPWGRPDMVLFLFTKSILEGQPINVFNYGRMRRDFTYIDDVVLAILKIMNNITEKPNNNSHSDIFVSNRYVPYKIYNIGSGHPIELMYFIEVIENCLNKKALKNMLPFQKGDIYETFADIEDFKKDFCFQPMTSIETGVSNFIGWYCDYYNIKNL
jgi:UDP-glucuronate 4-epimerase